MSKKLKENVISEALASAKYLFRHRGGVTIPDLPGISGRKIHQFKFKLPLLGSRTMYLDNQIPALIQDTFDNLGYEQRDGTKPVLAAKRRTDQGWHLVWNLPPGVSYSQVKNHKDFFQDACNAWIDLEWSHGKCHMNIEPGELPGFIEYSWQPPSNMVLPIPIGYSRTDLITLDIPDSPHLLIAGATGFGKTSLLMSIIHSLINNALVIVIDLKGIDFAYLEGHCLVAQSADEALSVLLALNQEYERRKPILRKYHARRWQDCPEDLPNIVVIVDELAEMDKPCFAIFDRLVRLARATGISMIGASQRTSTQIIPGDTRSNFVARLCFKVGSDADSRVVLGEDCGLAGQLPAIKGRAIYRYGIHTAEIQSMYLSPDKAQQLLELSKPQRRWNLEPVQQPETKRLKAR